MVMSSAAKGSGEVLAAVLPNDSLPWWRKGHLLRLNTYLAILFLFASANGESIYHWLDEVFRSGF